MLRLRHASDQNDGCRQNCHRSRSQRVTPGQSDSVNISVTFTILSLLLGLVLDIFEKPEGPKFTGRRRPTFWAFSSTSARFSGSTSGFVNPGSSAWSSADSEAALDVPGPSAGSLTSGEPTSTSTLAFTLEWSRKNWGTQWRNTTSTMLTLWHSKTEKDISISTLYKITLRCHDPHSVFNNNGEHNYSDIVTDCRRRWRIHIHPIVTDCCWWMHHMELQWQCLCNPRPSESTPLWVSTTMIISRTVQKSQTSPFATDGSRATRHAFQRHASHGYDTINIKFKHCRRAVHRDLNIKQYRMKTPQPPTTSVGSKLSVPSGFRATFIRTALHRLRATLCTIRNRLRGSAKLWKWHCFHREITCALDPNPRTTKTGNHSVCIYDWRIRTRAPWPRWCRWRGGRSPPIPEQKIPEMLCQFLYE